MPQQAVHHPDPTGTSAQAVLENSVPFGSPAPVMGLTQQASNTTPIQQALIVHSAPAGHQQTGNQQQMPSSTLRRGPVPEALALNDGLTNTSGFAPSPKPGSAAKSWTPMKASIDLTRQALENKLTKGKQLPANSLIAAGLDPTKPGSTPRPQSARRLAGIFIQVNPCFPGVPSPKVLVHV